MKESNFQSMFKKWVENSKEKLEGCYAWELKIEKSKSFRFDRVSDNQLESLLAVKRVGLYHKINDLPVYYGSKTRFAKPKPFDCFFMKGRAYVVIWFYKPREPKFMHWIEIDRFIEMKKKAGEAGRKSAKEVEIMHYSSHLIGFK